MKAVSAFISLTIIIVIVVATGGIISIWLTSLTQTQTRLVENKTEEEIECRYGGIKIDEATILCDFTGIHDTLNFTVRNTGQIGLYRFTGEIYLGGVVYTYSVYNPLTNLMFNSTYPIKQGESKTVAFNITDDLSSSTNPTWIKILTQCPTVSDRVENVDCT
ncbi:MAG: hypothetical protein QXO27_03995 [Candidatus Aenigmatarchaeota archaeon]